MNTVVFGRRGEEIAHDYLLKHGYCILVKNFRSRWGEIDIIARKNDTVAFIEVKTRSNINHGLPCEAVGKTKQSKIIRMSKMYLQKNYNPDLSYRFDIIEIYYQSEVLWRVNHIESAFIT